MPGLFRFLARFLGRLSFWALLAALFLASNVVLLTADAVYDVAKRGLWSAVDMVADVGPPRTHRDSRDALETRLAQVERLEKKTGQLETKTRRIETEAERLDGILQKSRAEVAELEADNAALKQRAGRLARAKADLDGELRRARQELANLGEDIAELTAARALLKGRLSDLEGRAEQVDEIGTRLARRTTRMISANMSAVAIEALPFVGLAAIAGMTFVEVRDACLTLADTRELSTLFSGETINDVPACGYSPMEFLSVVRGHPDAGACENLAEEMPEELRLDCVNILRPGETAPLPDANASTASDVRRPGD
ncbi:hypothetical protein [Palleronia rufa]|uniref:hypothetical protein n=1 Tax=Palleronia rufa TaxID=1530186 RepID=UPI000562ACB9|nr:hypothetical protein [Palleronia rufa]